MQRYEYKVIQATDLHPTGFWRKAKDRTATAVTDLLNMEGSDGWEFLRAEVLRVKSKGRFGGATFVEVDVLVFRRRADKSTSVSDAPYRLGTSKSAPPLTRKTRSRLSRKDDISLAEITASSNANAAPQNSPHRL